MKKIILIVLVASVSVGFLLGLDFLTKWLDSTIIADNRETMGGREIIPVEGGPSGPFSLSLEVTEVSKTIKGILVIKLEPGYSLINLDFNPDANKLLLVYKTPEGFVETANWDVTSSLSFEAIRVTPEKIKVLDGQ